MKKKKPGFTLMEMVIAMGVTVMVLGIVSSMFTTGNKVFSDSDVKSTLQIEGQAIQEKISDIGMQAIEVIPNVQAVNVESIVIKSYIKDNDVPRYFKIQKDQTDQKKLIISQWADAECKVVEKTQNISENLESLAIDYNEQSKSIKFNIELSKKKGFSTVDYPITFTITFRNKGN